MRDSWCCAASDTGTRIRFRLSNESNRRFAGDVFTFRIPYGIFPGQTVKIVVPDGRSLPLMVPSNKFQGDTRLTRVSSGRMQKISENYHPSDPVSAFSHPSYLLMPLTSFDNKLTQFPVCALNSPADVKAACDSGQNNVI